MDARKDEVERTLALLFEDGATIELRCLADDRTINGYYRNQATLAADAATLNSTSFSPPQNVYVCLNPVDPQLYARRADKFGYAKKGSGTKDQDVACRRWLLIDVDPIRPSGVSATDAQKQAAIELAKHVYTYLQDQLGGACLVCADSGNGSHIPIRLPDLPNSAEVGWVCDHFLQLLDQQFSNEQAKIDTSTANAAQICTLYGTVKRKGSDILEQPHRLSRVLHIPDPLEAVGWQRLVALVDPYPGDQERGQQPANGNGQTGWDIKALLDERQIEYTATEDSSNSGERWVKYEMACPFSNEHSDGFALFQWQSGAVAAKCHHDSCSGRDWQELKRIWQLPDGNGITAADIILPAAQQPLVGSHGSHGSLESYIDPPEIEQGAFYGPIGQIVLAIERHTEAAPIAVLSCTLAYLGNAIGRRCYVQLDQAHFPKLYVALVGATGSGRKGTADSQARRILDAIDPQYSLLRHGGLTTGEGMLLVLDENRDGIYPRPAIFTEREFAAVLKRAERKGNTLSMFIRDAWDNEPLANSTKNSPLRIEDHHVSICAHVTPSELKRLLSSSDVANGFSNRFLWIYSRRAERKPGAVGFRPQDHPQQIAQLRAAVAALNQRYTAAGHQPIAIPFSPQADLLWRQQLYPQLDIDSEEDTQLTLMCSRQAQQVCRMALIFAATEGSQQIEPQHLQAACLITDYVWSTVDYVLSRPWWGDCGNVHDPAGMAPRLLDALQQQGQMMRRAIMHDVFHRHRTAKEINALRDLLLLQNRIRIDKQGKAEVWQIVQ